MQCLNIGYLIKYMRKYKNTYEKFEFEKKLVICYLFHRSKNWNFRMYLLYFRAYSICTLNICHEHGFSRLVSTFSSILFYFILFCFMRKYQYFSYFIRLTTFFSFKVCTNYKFILIFCINYQLHSSRSYIYN